MNDNTFSVPPPQGLEPLYLSTYIELRENALNMHRPAVERLRIPPEFDSDRVERQRSGQSVQRGRQTSKRSPMF